MALPEITRSMLRNSLLLGLFAVITVGLVAVTQQLTAERITSAERAAKTRALSELLPAGSYNNHPQDSLRYLNDPLLDNKGKTPAYLATLDGQPTAVILQVTAPDGYSGRIVLLVGIKADGQLAGVRAIKHRETPGLGDKIEPNKTAWALGFIGRSLSNTAEDAWAVKKDGGQFDQFAGATITPRAVVKAVHKALQYFDAHKAALLAPVENNNG